PDAPRRAVAARGGRPCPRVDPAPHRERRLVDRHPAARARRALRRICRRPAVSLAGAAGAIRGLLGMAVLLVAGRGSGERNLLLAPAALGAAASPGAAHRPAAAGGAELPRRRPAGAAA